MNILVYQGTYIKKTYKEEDKNFYFDEFSKQLYEPLIKILFYITVNIDQNTISRDEFVLFFTYIFNNNEINHINENRIKYFINLVIEFRKKEKGEQKWIINEIKKYCKTTLSNKDILKTQKRDWDNLLNETVQILDHLKKAALFHVTKEKSLQLKISKNKEKIRLRRSITPKKEYFRKHDVDKVKGFELDHIIPFSFKTDYESVFKIDNWKNLIYIDAKSHAIKTQSNNIQTYFRFCERESCYVLADWKPGDKDIYLCLKKNILINPLHAEKIKNYNLSLHKELSY